MKVHIDHIGHIGHIGHCPIRHSTRFPCRVKAYSLPAQDLSSAPALCLQSCQTSKCQTSLLHHKHPTSILLPVSVTFVTSCYIPTHPVTVVFHRFPTLTPGKAGERLTSCLLGGLLSRARHSRPGTKYWKHWKHWKH